MPRISRRIGAIFGLFPVMVGLVMTALVVILVQAVIRLPDVSFKSLVGAGSVILAGCVASGCSLSLVAIGGTAGYGGTTLLTGGGGQDTVKRQLQAVEDVRDTANLPHLLLASADADGKPLGERLQDYTYCLDRSGNDCPFFLTSAESDPGPWLSANDLKSVRLDGGVGAATLRSDDGSLTLVDDAPSLAFNNKVSGLSIQEGCTVELYDKPKHVGDSDASTLSCGSGSCGKATGASSPDRLAALSVTDGSGTWANRASAIRVESSGAQTCQVTMYRKPGNDGPGLSVGTGTHDLTVPKDGVKTVAVQSGSFPRGASVKLYSQEKFQHRMSDFQERVASVMGKRAYDLTVTHNGRQILAASSDDPIKEGPISYRMAVPMPGGERAWLEMSISGSGGGVWWQ